jgi:AcrR family transcriptional regulator
VKTLDPIIYQIKKEAILQSARHLFATKGFAETTVDDIAQICHLQKASLYHYFAGKQQILQDMVDMECARWSSFLKEYETGADLEQTLLLIGMTILKDLDDPARQEFFKIIHFEAHKNPAILKALKQSPTHNRQGLYGVFEKHLQDKLPKARIAIFITQFMGALLHFATLTKMSGENICLDPCSDTDYVQQLAHTFARGISA